MSGVQHLTVDADGQDQRLDRWFRRQFPHILQGRIEKMCRKGEIRVGGGRVKPATRLEEGQSVRIPPLPDASAPKREVAAISEADARMMRDAVLYRDDHLIALNKPPGLAVQGGTGTERHVDGLADALKFDLPDKPRLVHRLDKDTSGVLLLARTGRAAAALTKAFQSKATRKIYWAAVAGAPPQQMGTIRFGLVKQAGHGPHGAGEKMICIHPGQVDATPGARRAVTDFAVIETVAKRTSWLALVGLESTSVQWNGSGESSTPILSDCAGAVTATLNNIGPGLGVCGPHGNYTHFSDPGKLLLTLLMLLGRLEMFAVIVLFIPGFWKLQ